jgi:hypothetical protein
MSPAFVLLAIVYLAFLVWLYVTVRRARSAAASWVPAAPEVVHLPLVVERVWFQKTPPRRSLLFWRQRRTGRLEVAADGSVSITVRSGGAVGEIVTVAPVGSVTVGKAGNDLVNTWVHVAGGGVGGTGGLYLNDAARLGYHTLLRHSNLRIADALVASSHLRAAPG